MARKTPPVPILHEIPHVTLGFGPREEGRPPYPGIGMVLDSCDALNTMHFDFAKYIVKTWPHSISAVYTNSQCSPIFFSGIFHVNNEVVSTLIPVAFKLVTPYRTRNESHINVVSTCDHNVAINTFVGLPLLNSSEVSWT